jgi:signal transduction histidine kinase
MTKSPCVSSPERLLALIDRLHRAETSDDGHGPALEALVVGMGLDAGALLLTEAAGEVRCRASVGLATETQVALERTVIEARAPGVVWRSCSAAAGDALGALAAAEGIASVAALPIRCGDVVIGHLVLLSRRPRSAVDEDAVLAALIAGHLGRVIEVARLRQSQVQLQKSADETGDRMRRLGRIAGALSSAPTARDVCTLIVDEAHAALGADWSGVWLLDGKGKQLELIASQGGPDQPRETKTYPLTAENPLCLAVRSNESMWLETWQDFAQRFPTSEARVRHSPPVSFGCLPLRIDDKMIGGLVVTFFKQRAFAADERAFLNLFAQHCAQGIERARLYDQAMDAIRVRDDFLSVAGHELRTPLSTLLLQTQVMVDARDELPPRVQERLAPVHRSLHRLIRLAEDVLDVSRMRAGRLGIEPEPLELVAFVRDVAARTVEAWHRSKYELRFEASGPIEGRWDPVRLEQIVVNLITNACKYGQGNPIHMLVHTCSDGAEIVVRDHGIGVAPSDQARIFERFERSVEERRYSGLGLGLWIARELARLHGGTISVRSEMGQGAEFSVRLPLVPAEDPRAHRSFTPGVTVR